MEPRLKAKYVVTGGAGFIGRNLVTALNDREEDDILIVDRLGSGAKWKNLRGLVYEDYADKEVFRETFQADRLEGVEAVFHLGACSDTTERDADYLADNNTRYTRELCTWCLENNVRFVYASSAATYGDGTLGYSDEDEETPTYQPLNMYGFSKHAFDLWALRRGVFDDIAGLKYFNVYGPNEDHKGDMRSVINKAYAQVEEHGTVRLFKSSHPDFADGGQQRDFVYVKDAVAVTLWFLDHPEVSGLFNCGTGQARAWKDLAGAVFSAMGREPDITYIDMPATLRGKYQNFTEANLTKLRQAGCDHVFHSLEDGVADYVKGYLQAAGD